jgi:hypothetical protein
VIAAYLKAREDLSVMLASARIFSETKRTGRCSVKLIWSPAVTLDGNIAKADGNSDWPTNTDGEQFHELVRRCGCVIVGRNTYGQYKGEVFQFCLI